MANITDCGMSNLLGAIFGKDPNLIKRRLGIPLPLPYTCPQCGKSIARHKKFCNKKCMYDYTHITLSCPECDKLFPCYQSYIKYKLNHKGKVQQHIFCSRKCLGKFAGRNYGFGMHPENREGGQDRKWNWDLVLHLQRETGFGALRLSRLTGIPRATIAYILRLARSEK